MAMLHSTLTSSLALLSKRSPTIHSDVSTLRVVRSSNTGGAKTTPPNGVRDIPSEKDLALIASMT